MTDYSVGNGIGGIKDDLDSIEEHVVYACEFVEGIALSGARTAEATEAIANELYDLTTAVERIAKVLELVVMGGRAVRVDDGS